MLFYPLDLFHILILVIPLNSITIKRVNELKGSVRVSGSKNAAIPILCTSLLAKSTVKLKNVPRISDIFKLIKILKYLKCKVKWSSSILTINSRNIQYKPLVIEECSEIRGSYYLIPVFLNLFGKCEILLPGGCKIGQRPIDAHLAAFEAMGYETIQKENHLWLKRKCQMEEIHYTMSKVSVGASINAILCALYSKYAVLDNLILEPEGMAVIDFLRCLGFHLDCLNNKCVIQGLRPLEKKKYDFKIIPDRMEAMTFILMGLLCGKIKVKNAEAGHMKYPLDLLIQAKYDITIGKKGIVAKKSRGSSFDIKTDVYPLFPTDMQALFGVLLAYSRGSCTVEETIFENRMQIYKDLGALGASINVIENKAYIIGGSSLRAGKLRCTDLRQGAAAMLIVLKTGGSVDNIQIIKRGYEDFFYKIKMLGADFELK